MADTHDLRPLDAALKSVLEEHTGRPVGVEEPPPTDPADGPPFPYALLYQQGARRSGPPLHDPEADARVTYQAACIGLQSDQVKALAARVRRALVGCVDGAWAVPLAPEGMSVMGRWSIDGSADLDHEQIGDLDVWHHVEQFVVAVTPADA